MLTFLKSCVNKLYYYFFLNSFQNIQTFRNKKLASIKTPQNKAKTHNL